MINRNLHFVSPESWRTIKPEHYRVFSILSTKDVPCIYGFAIKRDDGGYYVVSMFDYGAWDEGFIVDLKANWEKMAKNPTDTADIAKYIEDNMEEKKVKSIYMEPVLVEETILFERRSLVIISKQITNNIKGYSIQVLTDVDGYCIALGTNVATIDEEDPFNSILQYDYIDDLFNILIKSLAFEE